MGRKFTDTEIADALKYDSLREAEKITGESYKDSLSTGLLGMALQARSSDARRTLLTDAGDTHFSMKLEEYLPIVSGAGFETVLEIPFHHKEYGYDDMLIVMFHDDGILLAFDTYGSRSVNGGNLYYNVRFRDGVEHWTATSSGGFKDGVWSGYHDCREAILFNIRRLRSVGDFLNPWVHKPFLWLAHYGDHPPEDATAKRDYYKEINESRIAMLPQHVRDCIEPNQKEKP